MGKLLNISSGPHVRDKWTTQFIMIVVSLSLLPTVILGVVFHGIHSLFVVLAAIISAVASEFVFDKITHKPDTWKDGSAIVTGLMLAITLSPNAKLYLPVIGSVFAIIVVKCCFGGIGKNFLNPALAARCFLLISFGSDMTDFSVKNGVDAVSSATPVADLLAGRSVDITRMFIGNISGIIGTSVVALLVGGLFLWAMDIIHGEICFSVLAGFSLFIILFGGQGLDLRFLMAHICGGGVVMAAFYMATDYTTSPVSRLGQMTYGILIGVLGGLFRLFGSAADSFSYCVIIANLFTPLIDMYVVPKPYAYTKKAIALRAALAEGGEAAEKKPLLKRIPKPVIALAVITLVSGMALSGVFTMTKDTIDEQKKAAKALSYKVVCPEAESFEYPEDAQAAIEELAGGVYGNAFGRCYINEAVKGVDATGNTAGYVVSVTTADGNDASISLSVGVDAEGVVNGISFTELNETPGMGMLCGEPAFMSQFENVAVSSFKLMKGGGAAAEDEIDAISGATVTSSAVVNAVNAGLDFYANYMKEGE